MCLFLIWVGLYLTFTGVYVVLWLWLDDCGQCGCGCLYGLLGVLECFICVFVFGVLRSAWFGFVCLCYRGLTVVVGYLQEL